VGDFWQSGPITTIHRLPGSEIGALETAVGQHCHTRPVSLLIPALASEMDGPAFSDIFAELESAHYPAEVVLALGGATPEDLSRAKKFLRRLPVKGTVVWPGSENLSAVLDASRSAVDAGPPGKGRDVWIALGYLFGRGGFHAVALHDADIVTYTREIPLRLLAPLVHPDLPFAFCKGYYARVSSGSMGGRVTRLLVTPLLQVLAPISGSATLRTISAMRYALAGEFALTARLAAAIPIPRDWGLEVGILSAVSRAVPVSAICQADICDNYDHKHQELSPGDKGKGLNRMAVEVAANLLREGGTAGVPEDLPDRYGANARDMIPAYRADALANGLDYNEDEERAAVETFTGALQAAMELVAAQGLIAPLPAWNEAERALPGFQKRIVEAVERDNS
jgi:glucosyl-3-phosphoglycerate synthase